MKLNEKQKAALLLSRIYGAGKTKGRKVLSSVGFDGLADNPKKYKDEIVSIFGEKDFEAIYSAARSFNPEKEEVKLEQEGVTLVTIFDEAYPRAMLSYEDAPLCLYCKGDVKFLNMPSFAVIGTRFPTKYGVRVTEDFVSGLCERFVIVSGMARGIDSYAHKFTLDSNGKTVAVLGSGVDIIYPSENRELYNRIVEKGLVISEYPFGEPPNARNFPLRNRIISGLSRAVLITEAGEKSGTMITLNSALNQGKDVFCVPGSIYNKQSAGCNKAIRECQTRLAVEVNDIYSELGMEKIKSVAPSNMQLDVNEERIINALTQNGEMHFEEILEKAAVDLTVPQLNSLLIKMNAVGLITKTKPNYWSI